MLRQACLQMCKARPGSAQAACDRIVANLHFSPRNLAVARRHENGGGNVPEYVE